MDENGVGACVSIGMGARKRLIHSVAGDQRFDPGDKDEVIAHRVFHSAQPA